jgi:hypothetical protein
MEEEQMAEPVYVFVSYVRENEPVVSRLSQDLGAAGISVWLDRDEIRPGDLWPKAIRDAIREGAFFLACFSKEYDERADNYMREEVALAVDELRERQDTSWFVPLRLSAECAIPDHAISGSHSLRDIQWVDLGGDYQAGLAKLLGILQPAVAQTPRGANAILLERGGAMREKLETAARLWLQSGRGANFLATGKAFFVAYCWLMSSGGHDRKSPHFDRRIAAFLEASKAFIGGDEGWYTMLRERTVCHACRDSYRLENIRICTGCLNYVCGGCQGGHGQCGGELVG